MNYLIVVLLFLVTVLLIATAGIYILLYEFINVLKSLSYKVRCLVRVIDNCNLLDENIRKSMIDEELKK